MSVATEHSNLTNAANTNVSPVRSRTIALYGMPILGLSAPFFFIQFYLMNFATDVLLMAPAAIGGILAALRIWDAVTDPLVGVWSDRTRSAWGRRRPWMFISVPVVAISFCAIWTVPATLDGPARPFLLVAGLVMFYASFTTWIIPHYALGAELSDDYLRRNRIFGVRQFAFMLGLFGAFAGMQYVTNAAEPAAAAARLGIIVPLGMVAILVIPPLFVQERPEFRNRTVGTFRKAYSEMFADRNSRVLLGAWFADQIGLGVQGILAPYLVIYILQRPDLIGIVPAAFFASSILSIPCWLYVARRIGKRNAWIASLILSAVAFAPILLPTSNSLTVLLPCLVVAGIGAGCAGVIASSLLADVIDEAEWRHGERKEGAYSAVWLFITKISGAIVAAVVGISLQIAGFIPDADQTAPVLMTIRVVYAGLPIVAFLGGAYVLRRYRLDANEHKRIHRKLKSMRNAIA